MTRKWTTTHIIFLSIIFLFVCQISFAGDPPTGTTKTGECDDQGELNVSSYGQLNTDYGVYMPATAQICMPRDLSADGMTSGPNEWRDTPLPRNKDEITQSIPGSKEKGHWGPIRYICDTGTSQEGCIVGETRIYQICEPGFCQDPGPEPPPGKCNKCTPGHSRSPYPEEEEDCWYQVCKPPT